MDVALLQEAGRPLGEMVHRVDCEDAVFWNRQLYDRWPLVVKLSDVLRGDRFAAADDVPPDTKNVPTYYHSGGPKDAKNQLDYAFASRDFLEQVSARAMNEIEEWGPSDHCRSMIDVKTKGKSDGT